ncbi:MAG TPA: MFS transporter [Casimicrobiaceae bacterium]|nr:MFS transporter [Casimicrobiaceae bacterium]
MSGRPTRAAGLLLNAGHAIDHMFLLIFASAVGPMAAEFGFARWEDLMPWGAGAFALFGIGSLPAGRLGDHWGRRRMMLIFFFGIGLAAIGVAFTRNAWQLAAALTLLGAFAAIYHPVGIPMLVRDAPRPGFVIGVNGLAGNLGVALSAVVTGFIVKYAGWRAAFAVPALLSFVCGAAFVWVSPPEAVAPARREVTRSMLPRRALAHVFTVITVASISGSLLFNFTTNGNGELLRERFRGIVEDPALLGALLAAVYVAGALAQVTVGALLDRVPVKLLYAAIVATQIPLFAVAAGAQGWSLFALMIAFMIAVFGAIPFTDALIVRYVDDTMRSRVSGMRLTVAFGVSSLAVWVLGPLVEAAGFRTLLLLMSGTALVTLGVVMLLPQSSGAGLDGQVAAGD